MDISSLAFGRITRGVSLVAVTVTRSTLQRSARPSMEFSREPVGRHRQVVVWATRWRP